MSGLDSNLPTSRRGYLSQDELKQYANITINDSDEADDVISQAEEMIDAYVGYVSPFLDKNQEADGKATGGTTTTLIDTSEDNHLSRTDGFFKGLELEFIGGTHAGERVRITDSVKDTRTLTFSPAVSGAVDDTDVYRIYQLGKFPRVQDTLIRENTYYKWIPEAVKRAVAAQVQYVIDKGDKFFTGGADFKAESIDDYSYERADGASGREAMIAPKARQLLRGFVSRIGSLKAENPTSL